MVVVVDVDHLKTLKTLKTLKALKALNDTAGHLAGDHLSSRSRKTRTSKKMRSYDLVMRYGGDEFVCVLAGMTPEAATDRMAQVNEVLSARPSRGSMSIGVAELLSDDTAATLVARADQKMYRRRALALTPQVRAANGGSLVVGSPKRGSGTTNWPLTPARLRRITFNA